MAQHITAKAKAREGEGEVIKVDLSDYGCRDRRCEIKESCHRFTHSSLYQKASARLRLAYEPHYAPCKWYCWDEKSLIPKAEEMRD